MEWRALQGKASLASGPVALRVGGCGYSDDAFSTARGPGEDGVAKLWAAHGEGRLAMTAEATLEERAR